MHEIVQPRAPVMYLVMTTTCTPFAKPDHMTLQRFPSGTFAEYFAIFHATTTFGSTVADQCHVLPVDLGRRDFAPEILVVEVLLSFFWHRAHIALGAYYTCCCA